MNKFARIAYLEACRRADLARREKIVMQAILRPENAGKTLDDLDRELSAWLRSAGVTSVTEWQIHTLLGIRLGEWGTRVHPADHPITLSVPCNPI